MSDVTLKNPENLKVDWRIEYTLRCIKEALAKREHSVPNLNVTGFLRGATFYNSLSRSKTKITLSWATDQFTFTDSKYMQGIQLYDSYTGMYIGLVSVFDISALHRSKNSSCCTPPRSCGGKLDSIVIAVTSPHRNRQINSQLSLDDGWVTHFSSSTNHIGIKNVSCLGDKWHSKGAGKRVFSIIDGLIESAYLKSGKSDSIVEITNTLHNSFHHFKYKYTNAVDTFLDTIDTSKCVNKEAIIAEFLFNENFMDTFKATEGDAVNTFKKEYDAYVKSFVNFKNNIKRVVCHDLTTGVVKFYRDNPKRETPPQSMSSSWAQELSCFENLDTFVKENPSVDEKIAVMIIGLKSDEEKPAQGLGVSRATIINYIPSVGLGRYEPPNCYNSLDEGTQDGVVYYFLDDVDGE